MEFHMVFAGNVICQHEESIPSHGKVQMELKQALTKSAASAVPQLGLRKEAVFLKNHYLYFVNDNFFSFLKQLLSPFGWEEQSTEYLSSKGFNRSSCPVRCCTGALVYQLVTGPLKFIYHI